HDGDYATKRLLATVYTTIGVDEISPNHPVFVNFTYNLLKERLPLAFPKEKLVIEILEDIEVTKEIIEVCDEFYKKGYRVALDDFFFKKDVKELIDRSHIIKLDFRTGSDQIVKALQELRPYNKILLAEKVETEEEFRFGLELGFQLFQGYFFQRPAIIEGKEVSPIKTNILLLISEIQKESWNLERLEGFIMRDTSITYKLLKYINSAFFARATKINSVRHALTLLGERELKAFLSMIMLSDLGAEKPSELILESVIRAKFCEGIAGTLHLRQTESLFIVGLFSLLDAILDVPMEEAIKGLPLERKIVDALLGEKNLYWEILELVRLYIAANWAKITPLGQRLKVEEERLSEIYFASLLWANALMEFY
ncbi:MAG: EAL and HDOD domain-containing protein, partial [Desulfatiglandales bacterium]